MSKQSKYTVTLSALAAMLGAVLIANVSEVYGQQTSSAANQAARAAQLERIKEQMTVERLIGSAVSLANQDYDDVSKAIQRFLNGDGKGAREFLEMASQKYPQLPPIEVTLSKMHSIAGNGQAALQLLENAVVKYSDDPEAYLLLADQAFANNRMTEAQALFLMADGIVKKFSGNAKRALDFQIRVIAGQAAVLERRRHWDDALTLLRQWVDLDPDSSAARHRLGISLFMTNQTQEAFKEFKESRDIDPKKNHPYITLGQLLTQRSLAARAENDDAKAAGELAKARTSYERAYNEDGDNEQTAQAYAEWLIQQGELERAQEVAVALREKSPQSKTPKLLLGIVAKLRGDLEGVESAMNDILSANPADATAINLLALTLIESNDEANRSRAVEYAQMNAQRFPNQSQANISLAWILHRMGRGAEADQYVKRGVQAGRVSADSAYMVASMLHDKGNSEQAKSMLEQLMERAGSGTFLYQAEAEELLNQLQ